MATFYILPPRACLEEALTQLFARLLPGLPLLVEAWDAIAERLASTAAWPGEVYLIPRDDLPADEHPAEALASAFGAGPGDRVVEVGSAARPARTWSLAAGISDPAPAR